MPPRRWFIDSDELRIDLSNLPRELASRVALREDEWKSRGWRDERHARFSMSQWVALGRPVEGGADEDERTSLQEEWVTLQHLLMDLLDLDRQDVRCEVVGSPGGAGARYRIRVEGEPIPEAPSALPWFIAPEEGVAHPLTPTAAWACTEARLATHASRYEQLARVAKLRNGLDETCRLLTGRLHFKPEGYLQRFEPQPVARVGLRWARDENNARAVSLQPYAVRPDGTHLPLPLESVQPSGIAGNDPNRPLVLPEGATEVLERLRPLQHRLSGDVAREFADPSRLIPEGRNADQFLDLSEYSERVVGFEVLRGRQPAERSEGSGLDWFVSVDDKSGAFSLELQVEPADGSGANTLRVSSRDDALDLLKRNDAALKLGDGAPVSFKGVQFPASEALANQLRTALKLPEAPTDEAPGSGQGPKKGGRIGAIVGEPGAAVPASVDAFEEQRVPLSRLAEVLRPGVALKPHQDEGLGWLWRHAASGSPGVLLADDMGLGKTLQVACFLTLRMLETQGPRRPHLVVCPTILLDNWRVELERFFKDDIWPETYILHGAGVQAVSRDGALNTAFLERQDLILTNYETLGANQRSLLKMDFDVVVFDEAHNLKNPDTLRSRAARALKRSFAIALTGTPVENELADLWAIYDAIQSRAPRVFDTRKDFREKCQGEGGIRSLRETLGYPGSRCTLLRREKAEALKDLPPKVARQDSVEMTPFQAEQERLISAQVPKRGALWALAALQKLYQHPALLDDSRSLGSRTALEESPKTRLCLTLLEQIAQRGSGTGAEKALVFVLSRAMQDLLAQLIGERFGLRRVPIINGDPENRRLALTHIGEFSRASGFQVLLLSPLAAGAGLNIVAANHVIHYGRWWNPAKEDQATDRAHRIGQTRPVHVYYPLLHRPGEPDAGFDMRLHELVEGKRSVAREFLSPLPDDASQYSTVFQKA
ncbi:DEAD/DEAH box helicase [Pyxidicoccus sp. MSG2]|uniref:DEAD/DEAH box helicase n=1 Tax=Pyxidicoccus sp. MSG2 TaxID=2996790 RepID=UPI0022704E4C|nr:DEAD/DEAH box helicase [Pyxidicoccus sp. MSG2]MCY1019354.1 DEAD/DEAH box helicase [Pyxidicoccus sp. MSG2]